MRNTQTKLTKEKENHPGPRPTPILVRTGIRHETTLDHVRYYLKARLCLGSWLQHKSNSTNASAHIV